MTETAKPAAAPATPAKVMLEATSVVKELGFGPVKVRAPLYMQMPPCSLLPPRCKRAGSRGC